MAQIDHEECAAIKGKISKFNEEEAQEENIRTIAMNRYRDHDPDYDEDLSMDEWMAMSDEEMEREEQAAINQLNEAWAKLTPLQQYRRSRRGALELCIQWKKHERSGFPKNICRENLQRVQIRMLKIRSEFQTGITAGSA